jgi:plastocyanin
MRRASLLPVLLALAALAFVGCGGGGNDNSSSSGGGGGSSTSTPATTGGGSGGGGGVTIAMKDIQFDPTSTTVKVGQKVTWTNEDSVDHNVTSQSGETINSGNFGQGHTFSFTPTKAGTINYVCTLHPGMEAKLVVTQ